jgi:hypothetical protein
VLETVYVWNWLKFVVISDLLKMIDQFQRAVDQVESGSTFWSTIMRWVRFLGLSVMCYSLVILVGDYLYALSDMTEGLSYARWLADQNLYANDAYVQSLAVNPINERMAYGRLLAVGSDFLPEWCMILHFIFSVLLITGLYKWCSLLIWSRFWRWTCVLFIMLIGARFSIGGNELYSNYLVPSLISSSLGAWCLYFVFTNKWHWAFLLTLPMVFIQAIVGAQIALMALVGFIVYNIQADGKWSSFLQLSLLLPTMYWLWYVYSYLQLPSIPEETTIDFREFILFRMPHHFLIQTAGKADILISGILIASGVLLVVKYHLKYWWFPTMILSGFGLYLLLLYFHLDIGLKTQWLSTTTWLEAFSFMLLFGWVNQWIAIKLPINTIIIGLNLICLFLIAADLPPFANNQYLFFNRWKKGDSFDIAYKANEAIPFNSLVAVPPDDSRFRYISGRSIFIDFKSIAHNRRFHALWVERVKLLYGVKPGEAAGFSVVEKGMENYLSYDTEDVIRFAEYGITHWLTYKQQELRLPVIARNDTYVLYRLYR